MTERFIDRLCRAVLESDGGREEARGLIGRAIADTMGVAAAGFTEPVTRKSAGAVAGQGPLAWSGQGCESREAAIMVNAIAAHAIDFDDVFLDSAVHPSTVIVPAILELSSPAHSDDVLAAYGAGLIAARAVARRVGYGHYHRGWHATGTFGTFAATAAVARLRRLGAAQLRSAFALAAAQAGGLRANFSTMAKPCHAGFAAAAGYRSVRLAAAGVEGAPDVFAAGGFADLYGVRDGESMPGDDAFELRPDRLSLKLYPCCYAAHRLIAVGLDAIRALGPALHQDGCRAVLSVPAQSIEVLRYDWPDNGMQAKFSARYALAVALTDGAPTLAHFEDDALRRGDIRRTMERISVLEDEAQQSGGDIEHGRVTLEVVDGAGRPLGSFTREAIPGSPREQPDASMLATKMSDCLGLFQREFGNPMPGLDLCRTIPEVRPWLGVPEPSYGLIARKAKDGAHVGS